MLRAYKYRIYPTDEQKVLLAKTFGCCRFVYNWALNLKIEAYKQEKKSVAYKEVQDRMVKNNIVTNTTTGISATKGEGSLTGVCITVCYFACKDFRMLPLCL